MRKQKLTWWLILVAVLVLMATDLAAKSPAKSDEADPQDRTWTVAIIADLNESYGSTHYNEHVVRAVEWISEDLQPDLVLVPGDMVAGQREGLDYPAMWDAFHATVTDRLAEAGIPMAVSPGNHDASEQPRFWEERIEFARQWSLRRPQLMFVEDSFYPFYYAFEMGSALFISLDGTGVGELDGAQLAWLETVLEQNAHLEVSFLLSHVPQYAVAQGREREVFNDDRLAELMDEYDVDMMVSGHHHAYYPARRNGTYLLHAAALGSGPRALVGEPQRSPRNVTVVQFNAEGIQAIEAYESPDFDRIVDHGDLPENLGDDELKLWRMDIEPERGDESDDEEFPDS